MRRLILVGLLISGLMASLFTGCADKYYNAVKTIYIAGKKVVISNWGKLPEDVKEKLRKLDEAAQLYDEARQTVKPAIEEVRPVITPVLERNKNKDKNDTAK